MSSIALTVWTLVSLFFVTTFFAVVFALALAAAAPAPAASAGSIHPKGLQIIVGRELEI